MQIVVNVTVYAPMDLIMYPYDRHIVPFALGTRATKDAEGIVHKWKLCKEWPEWAPTKYPEDKAMLSQVQNLPDFEYNHKKCFVYLKERFPILCVLIERDPTRVTIRTAGPVFIVVCIALAVSGIKATSFEAEYDATLTSLLTLTALYYTVQQSLPKQTMPFLAWADFYFLARLCPIRSYAPTPPSTFVPALPFDPPRVRSLATSSTSSLSSRSSSHRKCAMMLPTLTPTSLSCWATHIVRTTTAG